MPWDESDWNLPVLQMTRALIALRQAHPALRYGTPQTLAAFNGVYAFRMAYGEDEAILVLNAREAIPAFELPTQSETSQWQEAISRRRVESAGGSMRFDWIPARSAQVFVPVKR
jgi:glycosidase